jgi:hypothetical protein
MVTAEQGLLGTLSGGAVGLLLVIGWELVRTLLFLGFILFMSRTQGRRTGRYPTMVQAAEALRLLLVSGRLLSRLTGRRKPKN